MAVFPEGIGERTILLRSRDATPFRVVRVDHDEPGIRVAVKDPGPASVHSIRIEVGDRPADRDRQAPLKAVIDHPGQDHVEIPVVLLD